MTLKPASERLQVTAAPEAPDPITRTSTGSRTLILNEFDAPIDKDIYGISYWESFCSSVLVKDEELEIVYVDRVISKELVQRPNMLRSFLQLLQLPSV